MYEWCNVRYKVLYVKHNTLYIKCKMQNIRTDINYQQIEMRD